MNAIIINTRTVLIDNWASFSLNPMQKVKNIMRYEYLSTTQRLQSLKPKQYSRVMDMINGRIINTAVIGARYLSQSNLIILQIKSL